MYLTWYKLMGDINISNVVFGEWFVVLRPYLSLKILPPLDLYDVDEAECKAEFRVKK